MSTAKGEHIFAFARDDEGNDGALCASTCVCVREWDRETERRASRREQRGKGWNTAHWYNIIYLEPCLNITTFHTFTCHKFGRSSLLLRSVELFLPCVLDAAGPRYSLQRHRWERLQLRLPQYRMQKCLVCFNADKADIFRGVSQTIPMEEQSPIWQCSLSEILSVMLNENRRDKTFWVCISVLIKAVPWASLDINKTSPCRLGLLQKKKKPNPALYVLVWIHKHLFPVWCCTETVYVFILRV